MLLTGMFHVLAGSTSRSFTSSMRDLPGEPIELAGESFWRGILVAIFKDCLLVVKCRGVKGLERFGGWVEGV